MKNGFEPHISDIGSDRSANWATTTALYLTSWQIDYWGYSKWITLYTKLRLC